MTLLGKSISWIMLLCKKWVFEKFSKAWFIHEGSQPTREENEVGKPNGVVYAQVNNVLVLGDIIKYVKSVNMSIPMSLFVQIMLERIDGFVNQMSHHEFCLTMITNINNRLDKLKKQFAKFELVNRLRHNE